MVDKFLELVKGGADSQQHLATCLHRLVLPLLTAALASGEDVVSKDNMDFIIKDMLGTSKTARGLTGGFSHALSSTGLGWPERWVLGALWDQGLVATCGKSGSNAVRDLPSIHASPAADLAAGTLCGGTRLFR